MKSHPTVWLILIVSLLISRDQEVFGFIYLSTPFLCESQLKLAFQQRPSITEHDPIAYPTSDPFLGNSTAIAAAGITKGSPDLLPQQQLDVVHGKMRNVLNNYPRVNESLISLDENGVERLLEPDQDGVQLVLDWLWNLIDMDIANDESFQLGLQALHRRRSLYWSQTTKESISSPLRCAVDEVRDLVPTMLRLWQERKLQSRTSLNMALQIMAMCATTCSMKSAKPLYANEAHQFFQQLMKADAPANELSCFSLVKAFATLQKEGGSQEDARRAIQYFRMLCYGKPEPELVDEALTDILAAWNETSLTGPNSTLAEMLQPWALQKALSLVAKCNGPTVPEIAQRILDTTCDLHCPVNSSVPCSLGDRPFNVAIGAWSKAGRWVKADDILAKMDELGVEPTMKTYNFMMVAYRNNVVGRKRTLSKSREIMARVEALQKQGRIVPDAHLYLHWILALEQSHAPGCSVEAYDALKQMELYVNTTPGFVLNYIPYNRALACIHFDPEYREDMADMAYTILSRTAEITKPSTYSFCEMIDCLIRCQHPKASFLGQYFFDMSMNLYKNTRHGALLPRRRLYTVTIRAHLLHPTLRSIQLACDRFDELLDKYLSNRGLHFKPALYYLNEIILATSNMDASPGELSDLFHRVKALFEKVVEKKVLPPNKYTFSFWLKCCHNCLEPGKVLETLVAESFELCKSEGCVSDDIVQRLVSLVPPNLAATLLERPIESFPTHGRWTEVLPESWSLQSVHRRKPVRGWSPPTPGKPLSSSSEK